MCGGEKKMNRNLLLIVVFVFTLILSYLAFFWNGERLPFQPNRGAIDSSNPLYKKFQLLSTQGNSSCSGAFKDSIASMPDNTRLQGSCCSKMSWHRYQEQVQGLQKYKDIKEIPPDPYDIEAVLAKKLQSHYEDTLTPEEQKAYDFAMRNSEEKGPCCCKCWRWYVYGGLAKYLIKNYKFTGPQIVEVWNLSDGCGGEEEHVSHT